MGEWEIDRRGATAKATSAAINSHAGDHWGQPYLRVVKIPGAILKAQEPIYPYNMECDSDKWQRLYHYVWSDGMVQETKNNRTESWVWKVDPMCVYILGRDGLD